MREKGQLKGTIITLFGASCWGFCSVAGKFIMNEKGVDPVWMVTLRLLCAGSILLLIGIIQNQCQNNIYDNNKYSIESDEDNSNDIKQEYKGICDIWKDRNSVIRLFVVAALAFAVCQTTYFTAISYANAAIVTAVQQTAPIFVLIWTLFIDKRLPKIMEMVILAVVVFGAFLLSTNGDWSTLSIPMIALIFSLISAITCAMYSIMPRPLLIKYGTFPAIGWGMLLAGVILIPVAKLWIPSGTWDAETIWAFAFVVIFGTVVAFGSYLYGITIVGPLKGSIYGLIEPVVSAFASVVLLGQGLSFAEILGVLIILAGVATLAITQNKNQ